MTFQQEFPHAHINALRYLSTRDAHDNTPNWSRRYEWEYAFRACSSGNSHTILNAACGTNALHVSFARRLSAISTVFNCDMSVPTVKGFDNFFVHDILKPFPAMYDDVVCVSTVEDFVDPDMISQAVLNLIRHAKRRVIITADIYDKVKPEWFSRIVGLPDTWDFIGQDALTGANSSYPQYEFTHLKVMLLEINL